MKFALIGRKLGHSWSQRWFEDKFRSLGLEGYSYELHEMPSLDGLRQWVEEEGIDGFNVTIPYKQQIIPLLDGLSPEAEAIGAVNCVRVIKSPYSPPLEGEYQQGEGVKLIGYNTDAPAFRDTLSPLTTNISPSSSAIILGTGGAARAVGYALGQMGINHIYVSRHPEAHPDLAPNIVGISNEELRIKNVPKAANTAEEKQNEVSQELAGGAPRRLAPNSSFSTLPSQLSTLNLLVNATPVGMWPDVDATPWPWPLDCFSLVYDLIYNPSPTLLLRHAAQAGATCLDGLAMLHRQAELSWQLWQNTP